MALEVLAFGSERPRDCILTRIDANALYCRPHGRLQDVYGRVEVERIDRRSKGNAALQISEGGTLGAGLGLLGLSLFCGVDGGPICKTPAITGLALLAGGGVLHLIRRTHETHSLKDAKKALYLAKEWPPLSGPLP